MSKSQEASTTFLFLHSISWFFLKNESLFYLLLAFNSTLFKIMVIFPLTAALCQLSYLPPWSPEIHSSPSSQNYLLKNITYLISLSYLKSSYLDFRETINNTPFFRKKSSPLWIQLRDRKIWTDKIKILVLLLINAWVGRCCLVVSLTIKTSLIFNLTFCLFSLILTSG